MKLLTEINMDQILLFFNNFFKNNFSDPTKQLNIIMSVIFNGPCLFSRCRYLNITGVLVWAAFHFLAVNADCVEVKIHLRTNELQGKSLENNI